MRPPAPDIAEAILGVGGRPPARRLPLGVLAALLLHALAVLVTRTAGGSREAGPPPIKTGVEVELAPPPAPAREPAATVSRTRPAPARTGRAAAGGPAARAATVVARSPDSNAPVDLTDDTVVTGQANAYAGGVTAAAGTSRSPAAAVSTGSGQGPATAAPPASRASPVSLAGQDWSCPWPSEADAEQIDEQTVVLRVVVSGGGEPQSATVLADPGHGFGAAARACAMRTHFTPARDAAGAPVPATSPPIRVRFTR